MACGRFLGVLLLAGEGAGALEGEGGPRAVATEQDMTRRVLRATLI